VQQHILSPQETTLSKEACRPAFQKIARACMPAACYAQSVRTAAAKACLLSLSVVPLGNAKNWAGKFEQVPNCGLQTTARNFLCCKFKVHVFIKNKVA
jgi:hypothetical protein